MGAPGIRCFLFQVLSTNAGDYSITQEDGHWCTRVCVFPPFLLELVLRRATVFLIFHPLPALLTETSSIYQQIRAVNILYRGWIIRLPFVRISYKPANKSSDRIHRESPYVKVENPPRRSRRSVPAHVAPENLLMLPSKHYNHPFSKFTLKHLFEFASRALCPKPCSRSDTAQWALSKRHRWFQHEITTLICLMN